MIIQGQGHEVDRTHPIASYPFMPCQSDHPFLRCGFFKICLENLGSRSSVGSKVKVIKYTGSWTFVDRKGAGLVKLQHIMRIPYITWHPEGQNMNGVSFKTEVQKKTPTNIQFFFNKANLRDLISSCDRPSNLKLDSNRQFFRPCDREIWRMTLQNNRAPLLCYFKLSISFRSHWWIQTWVTVRNAQSGSNFDDF